MEKTIDPVLGKIEKTFFEALIKHNVSFMVVGQTAAILQGAIVTTYDIDLWIKDLGNNSFLAAVKEAGATYIAPATAGFNPPLLIPKDFEVFDLVTNMSGLNSFDEEVKNSIEIDIANLKIPVLSLERVVVSKKAANRDKDKATIPALEAALVAKQKLADK